MGFTAVTEKNDQIKIDFKINLSCNATEIKYKNKIKDLVLLKYLNK